MQISYHGKTIALGDYDMEREAARAFDRALIQKSGCSSNFPMEEYADEVDMLRGEYLAQRGWPAFLPVHLFLSACWEEHEACMTHACRFDDCRDKHEAPQILCKQAGISMEHA